MSAEADRPFSRRSALVFAAGLVALVLALFVSNLTLRTLAFWWWQDELVRTELVVTDFTNRQDDPLVFGTVAATGEEVHTSLLPTELYAYDSPSDPTGTLRRGADVRGLRIPMWYQSATHSMLGVPTIYWVSEYGTLPTTRLALTVVGINAAIAAVGICCIRSALHRR